MEKEGARAVGRWVPEPGFRGNRDYLSLPPPQVRSLTTATGTAAAGSSRAQTSLPATTASTQVTGRSSATCATAPSPGPTTWPCT